MLSFTGALRPYVIRKTSATSRLFFSLASCSALAGCVFLAGCAQYRPVVTPITPTGPAPQPTAYFVAVSAPSATAAGLVTIINAFGDTVVGQATLSNGPFSFDLNASGSSGYNINSDNTVAGVASGNQGIFTLNSYGISVGTTSGGGIRTQNVSTSTIPANAFPFNILSTTTSLYLIEPYVNPKTLASTATGTQGPSVAQLTGATPSLQQEISIAPDPVNFAGASGAPRVYALSQGSTTGGALSAANACATPASVTTNGEADAIETATNTISNRIPVGVCPVYGLMSADYLRAYVLNRGSNNITVINGQTNALDQFADVANGCANTNGPTCYNIPVGGGPVYADLYTPSSLLVTANYDSNTVSVVNVPTDQYGNDGPTFGTVAPPITVGNGPIALTILRDGSRAYVANQNDCTVSVVNLTSFIVTKTIPLGITNSSGGACHPKAIASVYSTPAGKVYVASADSNFLVAISTETDTVSATVELPGNAVTVYSTTQNVANSVNAIVNSNAAGFGVPCSPNDTSPFCAVQ